MSVSVEKTSRLGRRVTIQVPEAVIAKEEQNTIKDYSKNVKIDGGFRKGSDATKAFIKNKYAAQIRSDALNKVLETKLSDVFKEQNLRPANRPQLEDLKDVKGENVTYTVSLEVFPEIELKDFATIVLEKEVADITDADIDKGITKLQEQFASWEDVADRAAQNGDKLTIDFEGYMDGEKFDNGSAENFDLELGSKRFIPGFEEGLVGVKSGDQTSLKLKFPENYGAANLAGKDVEFKVTVKNIQGKVLPPVDAEFASRLGIEDKDPAKVRDKVRENMSKYLEDLAQTNLREQALEKLYEVNPIDLPDSLVAHEKHNIIHEKLQKAHDDHNHDLTPEQETEFTAEAKKRVAVGLLLNELISKHKVHPQEDRVLAKLRSMAMMYGGNADFIRKMYYESKEMRQNVLNMVLTDQAADLIVASATIKDKKSTFYDIVEGKSA
jgi:trigger factor